MKQAIRQVLDEADGRKAMGLTETVIEGTLKADGTLELDEKPDLPAGRVTVVLRQVPGAMPPPDDPFWQRMRAMWAIPVSASNAADGGADTLAEVRKIREEWDEHQDTVERLQGEERGARSPAEDPDL